MPAFLIDKISIPFMPISHKMIPRRMVVYAKDVQNTTGGSERTACVAATNTFNEREKEGAVCFGRRVL